MKASMPDENTEMPIDQRMVLIWQSMGDSERLFVIERLTCRSDAEACRRAKLNYATVQGWTCKPLLDQYIAYQRNQSLQAAKFILTETTLEAIHVLRLELRGKKRLLAAKEILDRAGLPAISRNEISGPSGAAIEVKAVDYRTGITALAPGSVPDSDTSSEE